MNKLVYIENFVDYVIGKGLKEVEDDVLWEEFLHCPSCVISGCKTSWFTQRKFFYNINIVCKKRGYVVERFTHRGLWANNCYKFTFIHNNV